jgi:hypothetical protein
MASKAAVFRRKNAISLLSRFVQRQVRDQIQAQNPGEKLPRLPVSANKSSEFYAVQLWHLTTRQRAASGGLNEGTGSEALSSIERAGDADGAVGATEGAKSADSSASTAAEHATSATDAIKASGSADSSASITAEAGESSSVRPADPSLSWTWPKYGPRKVYANRLVRAAELLGWQPASATDGADSSASTVQLPNPFLPSKHKNGRTIGPKYSPRRVKKLVQAAELLKDEFKVELPPLPRRLIPREERDTAGRMFHGGTTPFDKVYAGSKRERQKLARKADIEERTASQPERIEQWREVSLVCVLRNVVSNGRYRQKLRQEISADLYQPLSDDRPSAIETTGMVTLSQPIHANVIMRIQQLLQLCFLLF